MNRKLVCKKMLDEQHNKRWNKKWWLLSGVLTVFLIGVIVMKQTSSNNGTPEVTSQDLNQENIAATKTTEYGTAGRVIKLEAEDGQLTGLTTTADASASSGKFVEGFDTEGDQLRFTINLDIDGTYMIAIRYKAYGEDKPNFISLDGERLAEYTFKETAVWKDAVIGQYNLNAGTHTFDITKSWGWIGIDYIQLIGGPGGRVQSVSLETSSSQSGPADDGVTLIAVADNSAEYRFLYRETQGEWLALNDYSRSHTLTWLPPTAGDYELKVQARGLRSEADNEADASLSYTALPAYMGKPLLNPMFGDHMVLQRDTETVLSGWAEPNTEVRIGIDNKTETGKVSSDGKWAINVGVFAAGGPYSIEISNNSNRVILQDVLFGDVWLSSGQSNMAFKLREVMNADAELKEANNANIRYIKIPEATSQLPLSMINPNTKWQITTSESAAELSAVAYYFASEINKETNVPIGILFSSVGGTKAESWTSYAALQRNAAYLAAADEIRTGVKTIETAKSPIALYNGMIAPLAPYKLKGVLWYQGESNWGERGYNQLLPDLMKDWRDTFLDSNLPFIIIQISAFGTVQSEKNPSQMYEGLPEVREAQLNTVLNDENACLVVTTDVGDSEDIHPTNKKDVGLRSALCALGQVYHKEIVYSGPIYKSMAVEEHAIRIYFDYAEEGLIAGIKEGMESVRKAPSGELIGFAIAGSDKRFYWASAVIEGNSVLISADQVDQPVAVRYGWNDSPTTNLYNGAGLPASPFRTDWE